MRNISLDVITVKSPCEVPWNEMAGDEHVRFCKHCTQNVYNISSLTRDEAETLINSAEGRVCVRYFVRPDNTILTADCAPIREHKVSRVRRFAAKVLAMLGLTTLAALAVDAKGEPLAEIRGEPIAPAKEVMGDVCDPPLPPPATKPAQPPATRPADPQPRKELKELLGKLAEDPVQFKIKQGELKAVK